MNDIGDRVDSTSGTPALQKSRQTPWRIPLREGPVPPCPHLGYQVGRLPSEEKPSTFITETLGSYEHIL